MKKIVIAIIVAIMSLGPVMAQTKNVPGQRVVDVVESLKSHIETMANDSVQMNALRDSLLSIIDDTVIVYDSSPASQADVDEYYSVNNPFAGIPDKELGAGIMAVLIVFFSIFGMPVLLILGIVIACLVYHYKKRRRHYQLLEKAIEQNYQIPEYMLNEGKTSRVVNPVIPKQGDSVLSANKWEGLRSGLILAGVGLCLFCYFGVGFMGAMCSIPFFIGVSRIVTNYLNVRDAEKTQAAQAQMQKEQSVEAENTKPATPPVAPKEPEDPAKYMPKSDENSPEPPALPNE